MGSHRVPSGARPSQKSVWGVALCAAVALCVACERSPYRSADRDAGTIYMEACFPCHAGGPSGPLLAGRQLSPEAVEKRLRWGGRGMPSFPGIRGQARKDLTGYVSRLSREGSSEKR